MDSSKNPENNLLAYFAAVAPALFQLIAVLSIGLNDTLRLNNFVLLPEFLNIANLFIVLITLGLITLNSFWDTNRINLYMTPGVILDFSQFPKIFWSNFKNTIVFSILTAILFILIVLNKEIFESYGGIWAAIQWIAYIGFLTSTSYFIYIFVLLKIQERNGRMLQENFVPRLMESLRRYGYVTNPDIKILTLDKNNSESKVSINGVTYKIKTTYDGEMISAELYS